MRFALAFPQSVRSLTLVDSALDSYTWSADWQARWSAIDAQAKSGDLLGARRMWLEHPLFAPAREQAAVAHPLLDMVYDYSGWHWLNADPGVVPEPPAISRLASVRARTLVISGDRDLPDFQQIAATLSSRIPGVSRVVVPGAGHMTNMEAPVAFNDALLEFLA
jgi:pimeloyl-ACP methyl ester carboxylesterase